MLATLCNASETLQNNSEQENPEPQVLPWLPPNSMKCLDRSLTEQCLGSRVFCKHAQNEDECLKQRRRPGFEPGSRAACRSENGYSEACLGTVKWCGSKDAVRAWKVDADGSDEQKSIDRCVAWRVQAPNSKRAWQRGTGCAERTEACLGTDAWCVWHQNEYPSQESCLDARESRPVGLAWQHPGAQAPVGSELRNGTEAVCLAMEDEGRRAQCLEARGSVPFAVPFAPDCPAMGSAKAMDERCVGSVKWCDMMQRQYKTSKPCLDFRTAQPDKKLAWRSKAETPCEGAAPEMCLGTETWCFKAAGEAQQRECFAQRQTAPLVQGTGASQADEASLGTLTWCTDHWRQTGYASEDFCFAIRGVDPGRFMASIYTEVTKGAQELLVEAALGRANATIVWEALSRESEDSGVWVQKGVEGGRELLAEMDKGGYLLKGVKSGVDEALKKLA
ncbi:hypothetical protein CDD81_7273 [Ophiocordyceps australis]|uniref:Uncharacterized protein n=1 Tax=Ophiocordyceps australis TaxID=1399860 RepID=A0A2C5XYE3_9HYPO|nr:hypothetical protein CDD81_7273 [Ophiocordyceps australis]